MSISSVKIVGSGLIGTSIGLALSQKDVDVLMVDSNPAAASLSQSLVNVGKTFEADHIFDLVIIAVPPSSFESAIKIESSLNPLSTFVDILSIKTKPQLEVESIAGLAERFVGSHPMAGREVSGAQSARGDLFIGRSWILTPSIATSKKSEDLAKDLINLCGGVAIRMSAIEHDRAMALVSHTPQILASLVAASLTTQESKWFELIGQGGAPRKYIYLHIVIDDKAGQLASIFNDCAKAEVNIEDVSIEHTPGQNTGLVTLSILEVEKAEHLQNYLINAGWKVHSTSK